VVIIRYTVHAYRFPGGYARALISLRDRDSMRPAAGPHLNSRHVRIKGDLSRTQQI